MSTSEQTRNESYWAIQPKAGTDRYVVLRMLKNYPRTGLADFELFMCLPGWPMASVVARRNELVKHNVVRSSGRRWNERTKRFATVWVAVKPEGQGELFPPATQADRSEG